MEGDGKEGIGNERKILRYAQNDNSNAISTKELHNFPYLCRTPNPNQNQNQTKPKPKPNQTKTKTKAETKAENSKPQKGPKVKNTLPTKKQRTKTLKHI